MKIDKMRLVDIVCSLIFMGSMWQLEIAKINTCHDWIFGYFFSIIRVDNWVAADFFYLLATVSFIVIALNGRKTE